MGFRKPPASGVRSSEIMGGFTNCEEERWLQLSIGEGIRPPSSAIATPGQVTEVELDRAKNATKSAILMNLESRAIVAEDIGRQILTYGSRKPVEHFLRCLDELTLDDITVLAQKMLSSPLTMGCMGDVDCVPSYDAVNQRFQTPN